MTTVACEENREQLHMPGMPVPRLIGPVERHSSLAAGQEVLYVGKVAGGPRYGTLGVVRQILGAKAVVDMEGTGRWHVPYFLLATKIAA